MAYIKLISPEQATGSLKAHYDAALQRSGRIWNIVRTMSQNPAVLQASMGLYMRIMHGPSPLSRAQREMVAVVVSRINRCFY